MKFILKINRFWLILLFYVNFFTLYAWVGMPTPQLHVDGRNLKDPHGNLVQLHGFAQTYSPWFNEQGKYWTNYNVSGCLSYNKDKIEKILAAGWKMNFIRMHMDPYWSNKPGISTTGENDISAFDFNRFKTYLDQVFIPMAEFAISKGLYVIMRPPGVCPADIAVDDSYNAYLNVVWGYVSAHPKLRNNPAVMFELANEPVRIKGTDGTFGSASQGHFDNLKIYFQSIVDTIRANGSQNILWIPGLGYQSQYRGYAVNPIQGENIGYAVHIYPGWFGSGSGYANFQKGWDDDVKPVADFAPICVTEMDWAPAKYNASWGKDSTGVEGGMGFGANFHKITDESGNVSWLLFTDPALLAAYTGIPPASGQAYTFLNDPQACPLPVFNWYKEYALAHYPRPDFVYKSHSDNGDGTYTNPVVFGDFPDPDVIRVGDIYYMVSTTMHTFPGATILKSFDLVNWEYCSNPLQSIAANDCYDLNRCNVYSHGMWASSLKYHKGRFYLLFNTLDEGAFLMSTENVEGSWAIKKLNTSFYDPGLLFDDDGKIYCVYGINDLRIAELNENFEKLKDDKVFSYTVKSGLEGSHLYKINGYYYIYSTYGGWPAYQTVMRSANVWGPYEEKSPYFNYDNIHQGSLIQTQTGEWWTMMFYDRGAYGRLPNLQPINWVNDWPEIGVNNTGVTTFRKPNVGKHYPRTNLASNDNFRNYKLSTQWSWNHNPDNSRWSLTAHPGYLRLATVQVADSLPRARNTLTQRILGYPEQNSLSYATIKMNIGHMQDGDCAGLAVFQKPFAFIGIKKSAGTMHLIQETNGVDTFGPVLTDSVIYLRAMVNYSNSKAVFSYSLDNISYITIGSTLDMKYDMSIFMGNRFALFNYPTVHTGGYVDIDWFSTEAQFTEDTFFDASFNGYSESALSLQELKVDADTLNALTGSTTRFTVTAVYNDGHTADVTLMAKYSISTPDIIDIINGKIIARSPGTSEVKVFFQGEMGDPKTISFVVNSTFFPLTKDLLNPSIFETGTFDESTKSIITGKYGFAGWTYSSGLNLSGYKFLVVDLAASNTCGASFRLFDENNYWSACATLDFGTSKRIVVNLTSVVKSGTTTRLDPSHLYIIGFWSYGGCPIRVDEIYVTNNDNYTKPTALEDVKALDRYRLVDVFNLLGMKIRESVPFCESVSGLPGGIYIVDRQKVII